MKKHMKSFPMPPNHLILQCTNVPTNININHDLDNIFLTHFYPAQLWSFFSSFITCFTMSGC